MARPDVRDVRLELKKYGQEEPGKKFIEELKARQKSLSEKQHKVLYFTYLLIYIFKNFSIGIIRNFSWNFTIK